MLKKCRNSLPTGARIRSTIFLLLLMHCGKIRANSIFTVTVEAHRTTFDPVASNIST